jgi:uncharacterized protein (DUF736 family)
MADFEQKPNTGSAWKNNYKDADNKPDFKGKFTDLHGDIKEIAMWKRAKKSDGEVYVYFEIQEPYQKREVTDTQSGYDKAKQARDSLQDTTDYDSPIDLSSIPFN